MQGAVQTPRLLIFDFDGTLADSGPWLAGVLDDVAARYRFRPASQADMEAWRGLHARAILRRQGIPAWRLPFIARHVRARMAAEIAGIRLFDGVAAMLHALGGAGHVLAVASSNSEANVRTVLGPCAGLVACFECGTSLFGKPRRFRRVLRRTGIAPAQALCIGDELRDADAAARASLPFGAVAWGYNTPELLRSRHPARFFATPDDIVRQLAAPGCC